MPTKTITSTQINTGSQIGQIVEMIDDGAGNPALDPTVNIPGKLTTHTGIVSGGLITFPTATTIDISDGSGAIVDQVASPGNATGTKVSWAGITGITLTLSGTSGATYIFIDNTGAIVQFTTRPSTQTFIQNIYLGVVYYEASAITVIFNKPDVIDSTAVGFPDYIDFLGTSSNIKGLTPIAIGAGNPDSILEFYITDGDYFGLGVNWHIDPYNPNIIAITGNGTDTTGAIPWNAGATFDYILGDGTVFASAQKVLDPTKYDDGTSTPGAVPNGDGVIQFIIELPGGKTYVQPFTSTYRDWKAANSSLENALSNFVLANAIKEGVIVGAYIGEEDESTWERGDRNSITSVAGSGGGGGGATVPTDLGEFLFANLPAAATHANSYALVTNLLTPVVGRGIVRSNGTNWMFLVAEGAIAT